MKLELKPVRHFWSALILIASMAVITATGCGGGGSGSGPGGGDGGGSGTLAVRLSDGATPGISALNVTIPKVEANVNGQWRTVATPNQTYDLLDLRKNDVLLGQADLPTGNYTQVRLFVSAATVTDGTGTHTVTVPSGAQTGIKINLDYRINSNEITEILLDFNVAKSLIKEGNGQYRLQPVIPAVVKVLSGAVTGVASNGTSTLSDASVSAKYVSGPNYSAGTIVNTTTTTSDGSFKVWALLPGTYEIDLSWTDPNNSTVWTAVVSNVDVTANNNTALGTINLTTGG